MPASRSKPPGLLRALLTLLLRRLWHQLAGWFQSSRAVLRRRDRRLLELLEQMRHVKDPLADDTVSALFAGGVQEVAAANRVLRSVIHQEDISVEALRAQGLAQADEASKPVEAALTKYLAESARLPEWADPDLIAAGQEVFDAHGIIAFALLGCASLPTGYAAPEAARVLGFTQELEQHAQRRLVETAQFLLHVMAHGGLAPGGKGLETIQRVRLMHAAIRHLLLAPPPAAGGAPASQPAVSRVSAPADFPPGRSPADWGIGDGAGLETGTTPRDLGHHLHTKQRLGGQLWDTAQHGEPIHQVVMCATILSFSYVTLRSMRQLGIALTAAQETAYLHCWNVAGHLMGVREELLLPRPETMQAAERLFEHIWHRFRARRPYKDGIQLTAALLAFLEQALSALPHPLPHLPRMLMRELLGKQVTDVLRVKLDWVDELVLWVVLPGLKDVDHLATDVYQSLPRRRMTAEFLFREMVGALNGHPRGGARPPFQIPTRLVEKWRL